MQKDHLLSLSTRIRTASKRIPMSDTVCSYRSYSAFCYDSMFMNQQHMHFKNTSFSRNRTETEASNVAVFTHGELKGIL